ncbi:tetratricopeptide repeat protein [bacterium]|nr:MAG: tetratricopeptide repeat protein [bacterium]
MFGFFSKKSTMEKALEKGKKLANNGNYGQALTWFLEVLDKDPAVTEARKGARLCREKLVEKNLEEASCFSSFDPDKAREHALLAAQLAGSEEDLKKKASSFLSTLGPAKAPPPKKKEEEEKPKRLFESSCGGGCASTSCGSSCGGEEAEDNFEDVYYLYLDSMPENEQPLFEDLPQTFREGFVALQQGELEKAEKCLRKAEKEADKSPAVAYTLALLEGMLGKGDAARKHYEKALSLKPDFTSAFFSYVSILREMRLAKEAVDLLRQWRERFPKDKEATIFLGAALLDLGENGQAEEALTDLYLSEGKTNSTLGFLWARLKDAQGDIEGAIRAYQHLTNSNQNNLEALIPLGHLYLKSGEVHAEAAIKVFKHCYRIDQEHGWYHLLRIAEGYANRGWHKEARSMLEQARDELPNDPNVKAHFDETDKKIQGL